MPEFPTIAENERTPLVDVLLEISVWKDQRIDELEQEILKLKGETLKPKISPTKMDKEDEVDTASSENVTKPEKISKTISIDPLQSTQFRTYELATDVCSCCQPLRNLSLCQR